VNEIRNPLIT